MKVIYNNTLISLLVTKSYREFVEQITKQETNKIVALNENNNGIYYYCILGKDSLTQQNMFSMTFSSDCEESNICFLIWDKLFIVSTGSAIYFVHSERIEIETSFNFFAPLVGLHLTKGNNLLILEELSYKVVSCKGEIVMESQFDDIIEDFNLKDEILSLKINSECVTVTLV